MTQYLIEIIRLVRDGDGITANCIRYAIAGALIGVMSTPVKEARAIAIGSEGIFSRNVTDSHSGSIDNNELFFLLIKRNWFYNMLVCSIAVPTLFLSLEGSFKLIQVLQSWLVLHGYRKPPVPSQLTRELVSLRNDLMRAAQDFRERSNQMEHEEQLRLARLSKEDRLAKKIDELANQADETELVSYLCPITREVMRYPVQTADNYYFERGAIKAWYDRGNRKCIFNHHKMLTDPQELPVDIALQEKSIATLEKLLSREEKQPLLTVKNS